LIRPACDLGVIHPGLSPICVRMLMGASDND